MYILITTCPPFPKTYFVCQQIFFCYLAVLILPTLLIDFQDPSSVLLKSLNNIITIACECNTTKKNRINCYFEICQNGSTPIIYKVCVCTMCDNDSLIHQGSPRNKTMLDKFMYNPNCDKQNYPFFRLKVSVEKLV